MLSKFSRTQLIVVAAACAAATLAAMAFASPGSGAAVKVGPKQPFEGLVNGKISKAVIRVICPGPSPIGHPLGHQTVKVALLVPPRTPHEGFTGTAATTVDAWLTWSSATPPSPAYIATFTAYGTEPIPTSITVPCSGSGEMLFLPAPGSPTAKAATVSVTFVNLGALRSGSCRGIQLPPRAGRYRGRLR
jgi:hypothetical protein